MVVSLGTRVLLGCIPSVFYNEVLMDGEQQPKKRLALACQGGGSHTAFTAGVLGRLLLAEKLQRYEIQMGNCRTNLVTIYRSGTEASRSRYFVLPTPACP